MVKKKLTRTGKTSRTSVKATGAKSGSGRVKVVSVPKPWGHETIHLLSGEIVYRVQGKGDVLDDVQLRVGESFRITPGTIHQMVALTDCDVLEVSTPELDDVVRLTDKYGREGTSAP